LITAGSSFSAAGFADVVAMTPPIRDECFSY
jgi:hypothetical protein